MMKSTHFYRLLVLALGLVSTIRMANAQTDPTWGSQVYYELECGGDGSTGGGVNLPEDAVGWWRANSPAGGGVPYTAADVYRATNMASQQWIYEFDLPDDVSSVMLRMEAHQNVKVSITGPGNVDPGNRQTFNNSTVVFQQANMWHEPVAVDLTPYLSDPQVVDPSRKIYLQFEGYDAGSGYQGALVFHVRLDNGLPSFLVGGHTNQYDDVQFIVPNQYGASSAAGGWRATDLGNYVIYKLKFRPGVTTGFAAVRGQAQYKYSLGSATGGPWTQVAASTAVGSQNLGTQVFDVSSYLNGTTNEVYLLMQDSEPANGNGNLWFATQATTADPRTDFGVGAPTNVFADFEVGGDNANANRTSNLPESYHSWYLVNSSAQNGVPYTAADVCRVVGGGFSWHFTYEFDLPDSVATPALRMHTGDNIKVEIADATGVNDADRSAFTGTTIYSHTGSGSPDYVTVDLAPYLASNPTKKFYLHFSSSTGNVSDVGVLYHLRIDDGWPSLKPMPFNSRISDEVMLIADTGSTVNSAGWREVSGGAYVIYRLDFNDAVAAAHVNAEIAPGQQTLISFAPSSGGPWDAPAPYATSTLGANDLITYNLQPYMTNPDKIVYMLLQDSNTGDALPGTRIYSLTSAVGVPVELSTFDAE